MSAPVSVETRTLPLDRARRDAVERARAALDEGWMRDLLVRLVETPSPFGEERAIAELLAGTMSDIGLEAEVQALDSRSANAIGRAKGAGGGPETEGDLALAYAGALSTAYAERLATLGHDAEAAMPACTTHLSVVDREGNLVALTQTLLSLFGSRVMFPATGVLMNNGVMWFDPRPGRPNSIGPGRRPLANMCPVVVERAGGDRFALGASGGRRIMPAVMQLVSFLVDFGLDLEDAFHAPRIDASGGGTVTVDPRFAPEVAAALRERYPVEAWPNAVYPAMYACPNGVGALEDGGRVGAAWVMSPWALAAPAEPA